MEIHPLIGQLGRLHTTELGEQRIRRNPGLDTGDAVEHCRTLIRDRRCVICRRGKNWYCRLDGVTVTVNAQSLTVITAHREGRQRRPVW